MYRLRCRPPPQRWARASSSRPRPAATSSSSSSSSSRSLSCLAANAGGTRAGARLARAPPAAWPAGRWAPLSSLPRSGGEEEEETRFPDFFGEPVTFIGGGSGGGVGGGPWSDPGAAVAAFDAHVAAVVSRGKSAEGGGDEAGIPTKSAHSYAISWAELMGRAQHWSRPAGVGGEVVGGSCPMLAVAAVAPLLAQAGSAYVRHVDGILEGCAPPSAAGAADGSAAEEEDEGRAEVPRMMAAAGAAAALRDSPALSARERLHLRALHHLLRDEHRRAQSCLGQLLRLCPGDALGLSLALDVAASLADGPAALRSAAAVSAYWNERGRRGLPGVTNAVQPGHSMGTALVAVGYAAGGRYREAERLADEALARDDAGAGGVAVWALGLAYDAEGRASEGTSMLGGYDGQQHYEKCGHLFFDSRLCGYGARYSLDREGAGAGRTASRMYGTAFERVIQYSSDPEAVRRARRAPESLRKQMTDAAGRRARSVFETLFGGGHEKAAAAQGEDKHDEGPGARYSEKRSAVDALCWLPPTPQLLTDATMLLLRMTMAGVAPADDPRWRDLRGAWADAVEVQKRNGTENSATLFSFYPLARVSAALVLGDVSFRDGAVDPVFNKLAEAAHLLGRAMGLDGASSGPGPSGEDDAEMWRDVAQCLGEAREGGMLATADVYDGFESGKGTEALGASFFPGLRGWDLDVRPLLDQGLCHAAVMSDDFESLCHARAVCSESVQMQPNSPESWWRYSVVLDRLGDEHAAQDARAASISMGAGEGGKLT